MATAKRPRTPKKAAESKETATSNTSAKKQVATVTTRAVDMHEAIRLRAYEYFEKRGYQHGADLDDWLRAEQEIRERFNTAA